MNLFDNPRRIEFIPHDWDWELRNALLHAEGEGVVLPRPQIRRWVFDNVLVTAQTSRTMLCAKMVAYDVAVKRGDEPFVERESLTEEEVEEILLAAKTDSIDFSSFWT